MICLRAEPRSETAAAPPAGIVTEYTDGIYLQDKQSTEGEIALAQSDMERAVDRVQWSDRMLLKGYNSKAQNLSDHSALENAKFKLEQSQTKMKVLEQFTHEKTVKELKSEVEKARSDELAKEQTWQLEQTKEKKLRTQIENCRLIAPGDGIVELLGLDDPAIFITGFARPNLHYSAQNCSSDRDKDEALFRFLEANPGAGIVYASTRKLAPRSVRSN